MLKKILVATGILLIVILTLAPRLKTLNEPHLLEFDTVFISRFAKEVVENGSFNYTTSVDRYYPNMWDSHDLNPLASYVIVGLCKINPVCNPTTASMWYAPILAVLIMLAMAYLGYVAHKDWFFGAAFLALAPGFLYRSISGFSDKDPTAVLLMLVSLYFVYRTLKSERIRTSLIYGTLAGIAMGLSALTMSLYILYVLPIGIYAIFQVIRGKIHKSSLGLVPFFVVPFLFMMTFVRYGGIGVFKSTTSLITMGCAAIILIAYLVFSNEGFIRKKVINKLVGDGKGNNEETGGTQTRRVELVITVFLVTALIGALVILLSGNSFTDVFKDVMLSLNDPVRKVTGVGSVHGSTVVEQAPTSWAWPWEQAFAYGGNDYWQSLNLLFPVALLLFAVITYSQRKKREKLIEAQLWFWGTIIFVVLGSLYGNTFGLSPDITLDIGFISMALLALVHAESDADLLTACLFGFNLWASSKGVRLIFTLIPLAALAAGRVLSFAFTEFKNNKKEIFMGLKIAAFFASAIILLSIGNATFKQSSYIHTSVTDSWYENLKWIKFNTREDRPAVSWWDYGYWIQEYADRPSIADGGNQIMKSDQELGLFFTEWDDSKAARWMEGIPYPDVELTVTKSGDGSTTETFTNEVFGNEWYTTFKPETTLLNGTCGGMFGTVMMALGNEKKCSEYALNYTFESGTEYTLTLNIRYKGRITSIERKIDAMMNPGESKTITAPSESFANKIKPFIRITPGANGTSASALDFGYESFSVDIPDARLVTLDSAMIGKMSPVSTIAGRPINYDVLQCIPNSNTGGCSETTDASGTKRYFYSPYRGYQLVERSFNDTILPILVLPSSSGNSVQIAMQYVLLPTGYVYRPPQNYTNYTAQLCASNSLSPAAWDLICGAVLLSQDSAVIIPRGAIGNQFTKMYLLDSLPSDRFVEVFNNGDLKSFYLTSASRQQSQQQQQQVAVKTTT